MIFVFLVWLFLIVIGIFFEVMKLKEEPKYHITHLSYYRDTGQANQRS